MILAGAYILKRMRGRSAFKRTFIFHGGPVARARRLVAVALRDGARRSPRPAG